MEALSPEARSALMSRIRSTDTLPERLVMAELKALHVRFRRNVPGLPGRPDFVIPSARGVIFVHGCFWHQHDRCRYAPVPASRLSYWRPKLARNRERDRETAAACRRLGWRVSTIWECQLKTLPRVRERLRRFSLPIL